MADRHQNTWLAGRMAGLLRPEPPVPYSAITEVRISPTATACSGAASWCCFHIDRHSAAVRVPSRCLRETPRGAKVLPTFENKPQMYLKGLEVSVLSLEYMALTYVLFWLTSPLFNTPDDQRDDC